MWRLGGQRRERDLQRAIGASSRSLRAAAAAPEPASRCSDTVPHRYSLASVGVRQARGVRRPDGEHRDRDPSPPNADVASVPLPSKRPSAPRPARPGRRSGRVATDEGLAAVCDGQVRSPAGSARSSPAWLTCAVCVGNAANSSASRRASALVPAARAERRELADHPALRRQHVHHLLEVQPG